MVTINSSNEKTAASGKVMQGQGVGTTSDFSTATYPATATGTGKILRADGTNWSATTATFPDTAGTIGNFLTSDGTNWSSAAPTGGSGAYVFIATGSASAVATLDFSNNLSATYNNYMIVGENIVPATNAVSLTARFGTGAGPTYQATNYVNISVTTTSIGLNEGTSAQVNTAAIGGTLFMQISNVNNATNYKSALTVYSFKQNTGGTYQCFPYYGQWQDATVITSIRFLFSSGNLTTGTFKLYGIVNS